MPPSVAPFAVVSASVTADVLPVATLPDESWIVTVVPKLAPAVVDDGGWDVNRTLAAAPGVMLNALLVSPVRLPSLA